MQLKTKRQMMTYIQSMMNLHGNTVVTDHIYLLTKKEIADIGWHAYQSKAYKGLVILSVKPQYLQLPL